MAGESLPASKWDQLWAATLETLYMTALSGIATFVLGIALGLALFLIGTRWAVSSSHFV